MTLRDTMTGILRQAPVLLGETLDYRTRDAATRTWGGWTPCTGQITNGAIQSPTDPGGQVLRRLHVAELLITDALPLWQAGLVQVRQGTGAAAVTWAVGEMVQQSAGTRRYRLERDLGATVGASRGDRAP